MLDIYPACIVKSTAGRDKGLYFIVTDVVDDKYVLLCDGDLRRIDKPKRKKVKHLKPTGICVEYLREKISSGSKVTNADIRKNLSLKLKESGLV